MINSKADLVISRRDFGFGAALLGLSALSLTACDNRKTQDSKPETDANTKAGIATGEKKVSGSTFAFDTLITLFTYGGQEIIDACIDKINHFGKILSSHAEGSDCWNINHAEGEPTKVHPDTVRCIKDSLEYCKKTNGIFDITVGSVSLLWDFVKGKKPSDDEIQEGLKHIDYKKVNIIDDETIQLLDPHAALDLGGCAKGWIANELAKIYRDAGATGIINLGGNVYCVGSKPDGSPYKVAIVDPNDPKGDYLMVVECADVSVVTSGLYERFFEQDGKKYYHILDIKTGYPAQTDLLADTVIGSSSLECDCYSTTLFIMGSSNANKFVTAAKDVEGFFVPKDNKYFFTSSFEEKYPYKFNK